MEQRYTYNGYGLIREDQYDFLCEFMPTCETGADVGLVLFDAGLSSEWESERMEGMTAGEAWRWFTSGESTLAEISAKRK